MLKRGDILKCVQLESHNYVILNDRSLIFFLWNNLTNLEVITKLDKHSWLADSF
jgi:hypothetical protein